MIYMLHYKENDPYVGVSIPTPRINFGPGIEITEEQYNDIKDNHMPDFYDFYKIEDGKVVKL